MQRAMDENGDEHITLTQKGHINWIINALGLYENSNGLNTPAPEKPLSKNSEGAAHDLGRIYFGKENERQINFKKILFLNSSPIGMM